MRRENDMREHYLIEAVLENVEAVIDAATQDEVIKNIPVVGTVAKLLKAAENLRDKIFAAKLARFFQHLNETTPEAREKIRQKAAANPDEAREVGEAVLLVVEKITALDKAQILAYVFIAFTQGHIGLTDFLRLCDAIDQAFVYDLKELLGTRKSGHPYAADYMKHLTRTGLTFADSGLIPRGPEDWHYAVSRLGRQLIDAYSEGMKYCCRQ
jgi:hypothetical protein